MGWERVHPFRSTGIKQYQMSVALLEKNSILWFKHEKSYCQRCVVWGWGVCSLALTKSSRNSLYFHLYRFAMNNFQLTRLAVSITTSIAWHNDFPKTFSFPLCLCPSYLLYSESRSHLREAEWSPLKEMFLIILLCINIFTFYIHLQFFTCSL